MTEVSNQRNHVWCKLPNFYDAVINT